GLSVLLAAISESAWAQKTVHCQDGDHVLIDVKQIAIQYNASSFAGTLNGLSALTGRLEVGPKKLQEAAVATQRFNELVKALVVGYNSCAVTGQQYNDGLKRIFPRIQEDAAGLEAVRKESSRRQQIDFKRLQALLDS